jgi:hypothetical protein
MSRRVLSPWSRREIVPRTKGLGARRLGDGWVFGGRELPGAVVGDHLLHSSLSATSRRPRDRTRGRGGEELPEDRVRDSFARARKDALGGRVGDGRHCFECCGLKSPQRVGGGVQSIRWCSRVSVLSGRDFFGPVAPVLALDCRAAIELGLTQDCDGLTSGDVDDFWGIPSGWRKSACGETTLPATARLWTRSLVRRQRKRSHRWRRKALVL